MKAELCKLHESGNAWPKDAKGPPGLGFLTSRETS